MTALREFVYSVLVVSVSGAAVTMFVPDNNGVSKYLQFLVGIVVTTVLLFPLCSALVDLPEFAVGVIEFDTKANDGGSYTATVIEQACRNIETELKERVYERFDVEPKRLEVESNGDAEALKIETVRIYFPTENTLLYSDSVNFIKGIFGEECEVKVMYEDNQP